MTNWLFSSFSEYFYRKLNSEKKVKEILKNGSKEREPVKKGAGSPTLFIYIDIYGY